METRCHFDYLWERAGRRRPLPRRSPIPARRSRSSRDERGVPVVTGEPTIGGRYSALSPFGLVPAVLAGVDVGRLLERAEAMREACRVEDANPGLELGLALGTGWQEGRDKVVFDGGGRFRALARAAARRVDRQGGQGARAGAGRVGRRPGPPAARTSSSTSRTTSAPSSSASSSRPRSRARSSGINPFDQPNVEEAKERTRAILVGACSRRRGTGPDETADELSNRRARATTSRSRRSSTPRARTSSSRSSSVRGRRVASSRSGSARGYLHSTGQLHKGGPPTGHFVQVVDDPGARRGHPGAEVRLPSPHRGAGCGRLRGAEERGRPVARRPTGGRRE